MIFRKYKSKESGISGRIFYETHHTQKNKIKAAYLQIFGFIFWLWRDLDTYQGWPSAA